MGWLLGVAVAVVLCVGVAMAAERQPDVSWIPIVGRQIQAVIAWHACEVRFGSELGMLAAEKHLREQAQASQAVVTHVSSAWEWWATSSASLAAGYDGSRLLALGT